MGIQPARSGSWLYRLPPWRAPRLRRHHHHHLGIVEALALMMGWFLYALLFFEIWMLEAMLWATIWLCCGMFLGARSAWRQYRPAGPPAGAGRAHTSYTTPPRSAVSGRPGSIRRRS